LEKSYFGEGKPLDRLRRDPGTMSKLGSDLDKSLEELEGTQRPAATHDSRLVHEVHRLRRIPLKRYRIEDLRLMIGQ